MQGIKVAGKMRVLVILLALLTSNCVLAQSDFIIRSADSIKVMINLDGKKYDMDGATVIKISNIPDAALVNVTIMLESATPKVYFQRHEFKGSFEWDYRIVNPEKKNVLVLEEIAKNEKTEEYTPAELGENFVTYRFGRYTTPLERYRGTMDAASSMSMKRTKEELPATTKIEDGVKVEEQSSRTQTVKRQGSSTVIHQERTTTSEGDERETTILRPRKEGCEGAWTEEEKDEQMALLMEETGDPGKLYISKTIAIAHCMTTDDAREMLSVFENEATLIEMCKFIYPSLVDPENFDSLEDLYKSKSSWEAVKLYVDVKYNR